MRLPTLVAFAVTSIAISTAAQPSSPNKDVMVRWRVTFASTAITVPFAKNSAAITNSNPLKALADFMKTAQDLDLEVEGNADSSESNPKTISKDRADVIAAQLKAYGVPEKQIVSYAEGDRQPAAAPFTERNRALNCRVDIIPVPRRDPLLALPVSIKITFGMVFSLSPDGRYALAGEAVPQLFDLVHHIRLKSLMGGSIPRFSPNGRWVVVIHAGDLVLYDVHSGDVVKKTPIPESATGMWQMVWSPDSARVVCALKTALIMLDVSKPTPQVLIRQQIPEIARVMIWDPRDRFIAYTQRSTNQVYLVDSHTLQPLRDPLPVEYLHALAITRDGKYLAATDNTRTLTVWDTSDWTSRTMQIQELAAQMVPSLTGHHMILTDFGGGDHDHMLLADVARMSPVSEKSIPNDIAIGGYSADGKTVYAACKDGWLAYSAKDLSPLPSPFPNTVIGRQFFADPDRNLVTTLDGFGIQVWDARKGIRTQFYSGEFEFMTPFKRGSPNILVVWSNYSAHWSRIGILNTQTGATRAVADVGFRVEMVSPSADGRVFSVAGVPFMPANTGSPLTTVETYTTSGKRLSVVKTQTNQRPLRIGQLADGGIRAMDVSADGKVVVVNTWWMDGFSQGATLGNVAVAFSTSTGHRLKSIQVPQEIDEIRFDANDSDRVAIVQGNGVSICKVSTGSQIGTDTFADYSTGVTKFHGGLMLAWPHKLEVRFNDGTTRVADILNAQLDALPLPKLNMAVSYNQGNFLLFMDLHTLAAKGLAYLGRRGDWLTWAPGNKVDASENGLDGAYWVIGAHVELVSKTRSSTLVQGLLSKQLAKK